MSELIEYLENQARQLRADRAMLRAENDQLETENERLRRLLALAANDIQILERALSAR